MPRYATTLAVLACVVGGCVPNKIYRPTEFFFHEQLTTRQFEPAETNNNDSWRYRLGFIEFDDRGEMFKRDQLRRIVEEIARAKADAKSHKNGRAVVAVFVHGWKNNASDSSGNVWGFRQVLAGLAKQYENAPVLGVYIGWRGAVLSPPVLKEFTFYDRQRKSQNLPGAHLVEALIKVMQAAKGADYDDPEPSTATILIGHSFGGAVLETALTQTLVGMTVKAKASGTMRWPANLIMFLNEAQEATRSYQLIEAFRENLPERDARSSCLPPPAPEQSPELRKQAPEPPAIVSISSTGDSATRVAFTGANAVRRPFNSLRTYDESDPNFLGIKRQTPMFLNTTAHLRPFHSHVMGRADDPAVKEAAGACKVNIVTTLGDITYMIVEKPGVKNRTPYWVMQMPPSIVPDHSTIFTPVFRNFLITLLNRSTTSPEP